MDMYVSPALRIDPKRSLFFMCQCMPRREAISTFLGWSLVWPVHGWNLQPITRGRHAIHYAIPTRSLKDKELFVWLLCTHIIEGKSHCSDVTETLMPTILS